MNEYPVGIRIDRVERRSRLWAVLSLLLIKFLALIPHFIILAVLGFVQFVVFVVAQFAVLFTGRYPDSLHDFVSAVIRWRIRVMGFLLSLTDRYPPFTLQSGGDYPVDFVARRPERSSRVLAGFTLLVLFGAIVVASLVNVYTDIGTWTTNGPGEWVNLRVILAFPHYFILAFFGIAVAVVWVVVQFVILFVARMHGGMGGFIEQYTRWWGRVSAWAYGLTDRYPPFSGTPGPADEAAGRTPAAGEGPAGGSPTEGSQAVQGPAGEGPATREEAA
jgi:hypothetical protein